MAETKKEANKKKKMRSENGHKTAEKKISDDKVKSRRPKTLNNWSVPCGTEFIVQFNATSDVVSLLEVEGVNSDPALNNNVSPDLQLEVEGSSSNPVPSNNVSPDLQLEVEGNSSDPDLQPSNIVSPDLQLEVEGSSSDPVLSNIVSPDLYQMKYFKHKLLVPPHRDRSVKRQRVKPPSYNLTGNEHISFVEVKDSKKKKCSTPKTVTKKVKANANVQVTATKTSERKSKHKQDAASRHKKSETKAKTKRNHNKKVQSVEQLTEDRVQSADQLIEDRVPCTICEQLYCESNVKWYMCVRCKQWACALCARIGRKKKFICCNCTM
jgi:hypothetical protein